MCKVVRLLHLNIHIWFITIEHIITIMALQECVDQKYIGFRHPFTCICVGPTCSGKTQYIAKLIQHKDAVITPNVTRVIYSYKKYQPLFDTMPNVEFVQGLNFTLDKTIPTLLVIDDQMGDCDSIFVKLPKCSRLLMMLLQNHSAISSLIWNRILLNFYA